MAKHKRHQEQQKDSLANLANSLSGNGEKLLIVVLCKNLKRMGETALRWSFFTLNMFILTLSLCQAPTNGGCPSPYLNC